MTTDPQTGRDPFGPPLPTAEEAAAARRIGSEVPVTCTGAAVAQPGKEA